MSEKESAHLVLSAGGVRCLAYIGALECLTEHYRFETVSACSAGTLIGALLCAGVSPAAMREEVMGRDLREFGGTVALRPLREVSRRLRWPYALYEEPSVPRVLEEIVDRRGRDAPLVMGRLKPALATAAVDVVSERLLVYSSATHPDMPVTEALRIATAVPGMYPPHTSADDSMEVVDAGITCNTPLWLATGFGDGLPIVVLRTPGRTQRPPRRHFFAWIRDVLQGGVAGQDAYALERSAYVTVHDIETDVDAFDFGLQGAGKKALLDKGFATVARDLEIRSERERPPSSGPGSTRRRPLRDRPTPRAGADGEAQLEGVWRQRRHAAEGVVDAPATVFISYAREDRPFVELLRHQLADLIADPRVTVWDDAYIGPGEPWGERIADAVLRARAAVVLVSASFNASDYIRLTELPLIRRQAPELLWVSVDGCRPTDSELERRQGFIRERGGRLNDAEATQLLSAAAGAVRRLFQPSGAAPPAPA